MKKQEHQTTVETRAVEAEVRMMADVDGRQVLRGYGLVYNKPSQVMYTDEGDAFREVILPGAAMRSLAEGDLRVVAHHDNKQLMGRRSAGTARFGDDANGLWYEVDPPATSYSRDLCESVGRRDITGSSFMFATLDDEWSEPDAQGVMTRSLRSIHVFDMGPVVYPAYVQTSAVYRDTSAAGRSLARHAESRSAAPPAEGGATRPTPADLHALLHEFRLAEWC